MDTKADAYRSFFQEITGYPAYDYQVRVAADLFTGRNVVVRAPTGAGKTWAVLAPFLFQGWEGRPARLIYALPLRTLAQGVYEQARDAARTLGYPLDAPVGGRGRELEGPFVTL